jgi:hypothetical protein
MNPRQANLINKRFNDENGKPLEGLRFIKINDERMPTGFSTTRINYHNGKIHGSPAIVYSDGLEEEWNEGVFIKVLYPPYDQRNK